jgi:hypothetical protein
MINYSFRDWLSNLKEYADFGFEKNKTKPKSANGTDLPIKAVNVEAVIRQMREQKVGEKFSQQRYFSDLQWGEGVGAVRMVISPFGGTKAIFHKLTTDLSGDPLWICKKVVEIKEKYDNDKEGSLEVDLLHALNEVDQGGVDAPNSDYEDLEDLTIRMSSRIRRDMPQWFVFEGIRKVDDNQYIIRFGCRGQGQGRLPMKHLWEFIVDVSYNAEKGYIRTIGCDVKTQIKHNDWALGHAEFNELFVPSQPMEEIITCVSAIVATY